jgi:hypothetical protein
MDSVAHGRARHISARVLTASCLLCVLAFAARANTAAHRRVDLPKECAVPVHAICLRADLDGDSESDLIIASEHWGRTYEVRLLLTVSGERDFAFQPELPGAVAAHTQDVDEDGDLDVVLTRFGAAFYVLLNNGHGVFEGTRSEDYPALSVLEHQPGISDACGHARIRANAEVPPVTATEDRAIGRPIPHPFRESAAPHHCSIDVADSPSRSPPTA